MDAMRTFGIPFGWMAVELDNVEKLEHGYGHGMVDAAVKMLARTLDGNLGPLDSLTRWGRAEFRIEVHSCWAQGLNELSAKLRMLARASNLEWWGDPVCVPVSIAGAMAEPEDTPASLDARAGTLMRAGRSSHNIIRLGDK